MAYRSKVIEAGIVNIDVRPKRAAFLIRTGSTSQFRAAVQRASSRWGGIQEPILPVSKGGRFRPAQLQFLTEARPDVLFDLSGLDREAKRRVFETCGVTPHPIELESRPFSGAHPSIVHDFPDGVTAGDPSALIGAVAAGSFASWNEAEELKRLAGTDGRTTTDLLEIAVAQLNKTTLIDATATGCGEVSASGMFSGPHFFYIAQKGSIQEALWFWNTRALFSIRLEPRLAIFTTLDVARGHRPHRRGVGGGRYPNRLAG